MLIITVCVTPDWGSGERLQRQYSRRRNLKGTLVFSVPLCLRTSPHPCGGGDVSLLLVGFSSDYRNLLKSPESFYFFFFFLKKGSHSQPWLV